MYITILDFERGAVFSIKYPKKLLEFEEIAQWIYKNYDILFRESDCYYLITEKLKLEIL